jgi:hypothetical protein
MTTIPDDFAAVLDAVVASTRVERYRWLCSDANPHPSPNSAADYRRLVFALHAGEVPGAPPVGTTPTPIPTDPGWLPPLCGSC